MAKNTPSPLPSTRPFSILTPKLSVAPRLSSSSSSYQTPLTKDLTLRRYLYGPASFAEP